MGCYGDSVNLTWDVTLTGNDTNIIVAALHTIDNTTGNAKFIAAIDTTDKFTVSGASYRTRMSFTGSLNLIKRKTTITITINKFQFIDATTFRLRIALQSGELDRFIKLSVQGMQSINVILKVFALNVRHLNLHGSGGGFHVDSIVLSFVVIN